MVTDEADTAGTGTPDDRASIARSGPLGGRDQAEGAAMETTWGGADLVTDRRLQLAAGWSLLATIR